jgi:pyruvate formate lyase activating enzyme
LKIEKAKGKSQNCGPLRGASSLFHPPEAGKFCTLIFELDLSRRVPMSAVNRQIRGMVREAQQDKRPAEELSGYVFDIKKYAIHDGPGIRTTVFFKGCPLRCRWCHNPESWKEFPELGFRKSRCIRCGSCVVACANGAISLTENGPVTDEDACQLCGKCVDVCVTHAREIIGWRASVGEIMEAVEKDIIFYDQSGGGVTFSGGEPLMQPDFLLALLESCRVKEIHTAVDTTCYAEPALFERVAQKADMFLCDLKHMDEEKHTSLTGVSNSLILRNIRWLSDVGKSTIIRMPIIPGFNDDRKNVTMTGEFVASLPGISHVDILPFNRGGREKSTRLVSHYDIVQAETPDHESMAEIADVFRKLGLTVKING